MSTSTRRAAAAASVGAVFLLARALTIAQSPAAIVAAANAAGWQIPENAEQEKSPLAPTAAVLSTGKELFSSNCQKCHGATGRGDGPYADPEHLPADLTASTTPDGVMFYKVWDGRKAPLMPSFKSAMTKDEIWAVIEFAKSLRPASSQPARVFDSGITFAQFLDRAKAQREVWLKNASITDVPPDAVNRLKRVREGLRVLIVAEDWCVDSVHTVPYIANVAAAAGVDVRIVDRAAGESVASAHRARDGRPVTPIVVLLRNDRDVGAWVERPAALQELFLAMVTSPENARQFAERATWYDDDRGRTTIAEFVALAERTAQK